MLLPKGKHKSTFFKKEIKDVLAECLDSGYTNLKKEDTALNFRSGITLIQKSDACPKSRPTKTNTALQMPNTLFRVDTSLGMPG